MFRKEPAVMEAWTPDKPLVCAHMQEEITREAVKMLKPGGMLLYSTCTFSPEENEKQVARMLLENPELELLEITPESIRIRKRILDPTLRKRASFNAKNK